MRATACAAIALSLASLASFAGERAGGSELLPNGDFEAGPRGWRYADGTAVREQGGLADAVRIVHRQGVGRSRALELSGRGAGVATRVQSAAAPVAGLRRVRLTAAVQLLEPERAVVEVALEWLDAAGRSLGVAPPHEAIVAAGEWEAVERTATPPEGAARARVRLGVPPEAKARFDELSLTEVLAEPRLVSLAPAVPLAAPEGPVEIVVRLANDGGLASASLVLDLRLAGEDTRRGLPPLAPGEARVVRLALPAPPPGIARAEARLTSIDGEHGRLAAPVAIRGETPAALEISSGERRLRFHSVRGRCVGVELLDLAEGQERSLATMPGLARFALARQAATHLFSGPVQLRGQEVQGRAEALGLVLEVTFAPAADGGFRIEGRLSARKRVELAAWVFPELVVGADEAKDGALLGGLELLDRRTPSSSPVAADPAIASRRLPEPDAVAAPYALVAREGVTVGLSWDPTRPWARGRDRPGVWFDVPDRWSGGGGHRLALLLPSGPAARPPDRLAARPPLVLVGGRGIELAARLVVRDTPDPARALAAELQLEGLPEPELPAGGLARLDEDALSFALDAFDPKAGGWVPRQGAEPGWHRDLAAALLTRAGGRDDRTGRRAREQVEAASARLLESGAAGDLGLEVALEVGHLPQALRALRGARGHLRHQAPDGSFPFRPRTEGERRLGRPGEVESGTTAGPLAELLELGATLGDERALAAARRGLEFLLQHCEVPAGAQTWEVPLAAPDLLAVASLIELELDGAEVFADDPQFAELLRADAARRARQGLAFVYTWQAPGRPGMRYATTPVFGASHRWLPWWGRPVQWVGLRYAAACARLAPLDASFPWRRLAEGIVGAAAIWIERAREPGVGNPWPGALPDAFRLVDGAFRPPWVGAQHTLAALDALEGRRRLYRAALRVGERTVRITSAFPLEDLSVEGKRLILVLDGPAGALGQLVVAPLRAAPGEVRSGGRALPIVAEEGFEVAACTHLADIDALLVSLRSPGGRFTVELDGLP